MLVADPGCVVSHVGVEPSCSGEKLLQLYAAHLICATDYLGYSWACRRRLAARSRKFCRASSSLRSDSAHPSGVISEELVGVLSPGGFDQLVDIPSVTIDQPV